MTRVGALSDLKQTGVRVVQIQSKAVALFYVEDTVYAVEDYCPHRGGPLSEGERDGTELICPWHGARFDLRDGVCHRRGLRSLISYPVHIVDGQIEVSVSPSDCVGSESSHSDR